MPRRDNALFCAAFVLLLLPACRPKYPKCSSDEHCREGEFCVNGLCQGCRSDSDCGAGKRCAAGRCEAIPGYCAAATDCPES